jgi:hypothetical protein
LFPPPRLLRFPPIYYPLFDNPSNILRGINREVTQYEIFSSLLLLQIFSSAPRTLKIQSVQLPR